MAESWLLVFIGVAIPASIPAFMGSFGAAFLSAAMAFIGMAMLVSVNPLIGLLFWLGAFLPPVFASRAKKRREIEERRHQEMLSAVRNPMGRWPS